MGDHTGGLRDCWTGNCTGRRETARRPLFRDLISQRTDTMAGFYAGEIGRDEAIETIAYMETDLLMQTDIENIDRYFRTDIEQVKKYQFEHIRIT